MTATHEPGGVPDDFFVVGGTLARVAPSYVSRAADTQLLKSVRAREFCYVLTARQMGKSSLMVRTAQRLRDEGFRVAVVDLTSIGTVPAEKWYLGLLDRIRRDLGLATDAQAWWQEHADFGPAERFVEFLRSFVLKEVQEPVAIFIDEIDSTLNLDFRDDFFAAVRALYNARATDPVLERLTFVLLGVATPSELIQDRERTPFNIGQRILLEEFSYEEARPLRDGLESYHPGYGDVIFRRIFDWSNGHPYLTQKLCQVAVSQQDQAWDPARVDGIVDASFFTEEGRKDTNLTFVRDRVQSTDEAERRRMLRLYQQVVKGKAVVDDDRSTVQNRLELFGLVRVKQGRLHVRNNLYAHIFDQDWIRANMPPNSRIMLAAIVMAVLTIIVALVVVQSGPKPVSEEARVCLENWQASESDRVARIEALGCLFELGQHDRKYTEQVLDLFYDLDADEQLDLFDAITAPEAGKWLVPAIDGIARTLEDLPGDHDLDLMKAMADSLVGSNQPGAKQLMRQLRDWHRARQIASLAQNEEELVAAANEYDAALERGDQPVIRYDRALVLIRLKNYPAALDDLNQILELAEQEPTPTPTLTPTPAPAATVTSLTLASVAPEPRGTSAPATGGTQVTSPLPAATEVMGLTPAPSPSLAATAEPMATKALAVLFQKRFVGRERIRETVQELIVSNLSLLAFLRVQPGGFALLSGLDLAGSTPTIIDIVDGLPKHPTERYSSRPISSITTIVVHHSAVSSGVSVEEMAEYAIGERDFPGIGYHFVVDSDGKVYQTNRLETASWHTSQANDYSVGIVFSGDFTSTIPTPAQIKAGGQLIAWLMQELQIPLENVKGHKEMPFNDTSDPGQQWLKGQRWKDMLLDSIIAANPAVAAITPSYKAAVVVVTTTPEATEVARPTGGAPVGDKIAIGARVYVTQLSNLRRTPGFENKAANDITYEIPASSELIVIAGPQAADGLTWWQVRYTSRFGNHFDGWVAATKTSGEPQLVAAPTPALAEPTAGSEVPAWSVVPDRLFETGQTVCNASSQAVSVHRSPGNLDKPADDVQGEFAAYDQAVVVDGPVEMDGLTWWQVSIATYDPSLIGWMEMASMEGRRLLVPAEFCDLKLGNPFEGTWRVTQLFGERPEFYSRYSYDGVALRGHNGVDFGTPNGIKILATDDGEVAQVGYEASGFGNFLKLTHPWGESVYAQMESVGVKEDDKVKRGDVLGTSGNTGNSSSPHLHFGIRINPYKRGDGWGGYSDPLPFFEEQVFTAMVTPDVVVDTPSFETRPLLDSPYIYGLYEPGGEYIMLGAGIPGWVEFNEAIGAEPKDETGKDFSPWSSQGLGVIVKLVNGYHPTGTLPSSDRYEAFAQRCGNFVRASQGAHIWIVGNEMNSALERPGAQVDYSGQSQQIVNPGEVITPQLYANAYRQCRNAIKAVPGHENDQVLIGAVAPWNNQTKYEGNPNGDWVQYFADILKIVGPGNTDGFTLHAYTSEADPSQIQSDQLLDPPFGNRHAQFRAYRDFMNAVPASMRQLPVYITETNPNVTWPDENTGWVQNAYAEIDEWNSQPDNQPIRALVLYRWPRLDSWYIEGKQGVIEDFRQAMQNTYRWNEASLEPSTQQ